MRSSLRPSGRGQRLVELAARLGDLSLGIYLAHLVLRNPLASVASVSGLMSGSGEPPWMFLALFVVTAALVAVGVRVPGVRRLFTG